MTFKSKLKNLKVVRKLRVYQICMIILMLIMGSISIFLSFLMNSKVYKITDVWSPSLSYVQELNNLTSEYRLKQYGHLVATEENIISAYENDLKTIDQQIIEIKNKIQVLISTRTEQEKYDNICTKWESYKEHSKEVVELSRTGKKEEARLLMEIGRAHV